MYTTHTATHANGNTTVSVSVNGQVKQQVLPTAIYNLFVSLNTPVANQTLQLAMQQACRGAGGAVGLTKGQACTLLEKFTPGYNAFSGFALLVGSNIGRNRFFASAATVAEIVPASMLTRQNAPNSAAKTGGVAVLAENAPETESTESV